MVAIVERFIRALPNAERKEWNEQQLQNTKPVTTLINMAPSSDIRALEAALADGILNKKGTNVPSHEYSEPIGTNQAFGRLMDLTNDGPNANRLAPLEDSPHPVVIVGARRASAAVKPAIQRIVEKQPIRTNVISLEPRKQLPEIHPILPRTATIYSYAEEKERRRPEMYSQSPKTAKVDTVLKKEDAVARSYLRLENVRKAATTEWFTPESAVEMFSGLREYLEKYRGTDMRGFYEGRNSGVLSDLKKHLDQSSSVDVYQLAVFLERHYGESYKEILGGWKNRKSREVFFPALIDAFKAA